MKSVKLMKTERIFSMKLLLLDTFRLGISLSLFIASLNAFAWPGLKVKPLAKNKSDLALGESGTYYQLSDNERKELVWMAKAAKAAYEKESKPLGYRSFSRDEWDSVAEGCDDIVYTEDGYFRIGDSGLRGRLMVNMLNEGRVILALSGTDFGLKEFVSGETAKDAIASIHHYFSIKQCVDQYRQALRIMQGVLSTKHRSELWIAGHSLGGSLTTYLALNLPRSCTKVKCATFNGYGVSMLLRTKDEDAELANVRLRNVYCEGDLVYKIPAKHFGPSYSIKVKGLWLKQHSLDTMLEAMIKHRTKWKGL